LQPTHQTCFVVVCSTRCCSVPLTLLLLKLLAHSLPVDVYARSSAPSRREARASTGARHRRLRRRVWAPRVAWRCFGPATSRRSPHLRCLSIARNFQAQLASSRPISTWQQSTWGRTELLCRSSARNFFPVTQHYFIHPGSSSSIPRAENGANHAEDFVVGRGVGLLIILQPLSARC
jgi:hypothetical protein